MPGGFAVSGRGVHVPAGLREVVTVHFGRERVWSFSPERERWPLNRGWVRWPSVLDGHLDGVADVRLVLRGNAEAVFSERVRFGSGADPLRLVDRAGSAVAVDRAGHLIRTFARTDPGVTDAVLDHVERVLHDLREQCGLDAFLTYGCLLGAVRNGHMIGHDSDADVAYLSGHAHPFDIIRENQRVRSTMRSLGWSIAQMSAADFKIWIRPGGGRRVGIDVFTAFRVSGSFYVMPDVTGDLPPCSVLPLGEVTLEGRRLPAPAKPEALLELVYGPGWRVPDPSFDFVAPRATVRRIGGWMRSSRRHVKHWNDFYGSRASERVPTTPAPFARWVADRLEAPQHILDVGCGNGRDAVFFAGRGHRVTALDASPVARRLTRRLAGRHAPDVRVAHLNLNDLTSLLPSGARFAHLTQPPQIYARLLLDSVEGETRRNFFRWAAMIQRRGGTTYLEFRTWRGVLRANAFPFHYRALLDPRRVVAEIESRGGCVVHREEGVGLARFERDDPRVCRLTVRWA